MYCGICGKLCSYKIENEHVSSEFWGRLRNDTFTAVISDCCEGAVYADGADSNWDDPITTDDLGE